MLEIKNLSVSVGDRAADSLSVTGEGKFLLAVSSAEALAKAEGLEKLGEGVMLPHHNTLTRRTSCADLSHEGEVNALIGISLEGSVG